MMLKKIIPAFVVLAALLAGNDANCQDEATVMKTLAGRLTSYCSAFPREEIYVKTDRDHYISGEDIWFSVFLFDRQSNQLSGSSSLAYIEILNPDNRPVLQKKIRLENGNGACQAGIPDSLSTGRYLVRAYTNYMKNFLPVNCFTREITIISPFGSKSLGKALRPLSGSLASGNEVLNKGLSFTVDRSKIGVAELTVNTNQTFRSLNKNRFFLIVSTRGKIDRMISGYADGDQTHVTLPSDAFSAGINQLTIFDMNGLPVAEKYIYTPDLHKADPSVTVADSFGLRNRIMVKLTGAPTNGKSISGELLSTAVTPAATNSGMIDDYMIFASEFGSGLPLIINDRRLTELPVSAIDSLLDGMKSKWIDWNKIVTGSFPSIRYYPENNTHYITGKLLTRDEGISAGDKYVLMSTPGKAATFQYAKTDKDGSFFFSLTDEQRPIGLVIQPTEAGKNSTVRLESSFSDVYPVIAGHEPFRESSAEAEYVRKMKVNYQVNKIYGITSLGTIIPPSVAPTKRVRFYGKPDIGLVMADYIKLPVMSEVFFELLPGVNLRNRKSGYEIEMLDPVANRYFEAPPCLMVDGVIVNDASLIAGIDPELVERIDVVKDKYFVGDYMFYGIINVITHSADLSSIQLPANAVRLSYRVSDQAWTFSSPDYSSAEMKKSRLPDFRNTLYWNPSVMTDITGKGEFEFSSSDMKGEYCITIEGVSPEGKIIAAKKKITVR